MVVGKQRSADEHEQCPDGYRHQHADVRRLLRLVVVLGSQIALHDGLVGAIFLQGVEDAVEHHHDERQLRQVPVVGTEAYLVVFRCNAERLRRSALDAEHQDADADDAAADEQEPLRHVHPHNSLHAAKQRQHDNRDAQHKHNRVDVDVKECRQCHRHQEEHRAGLREVAQREGKRRVETGKESEATLEVLVG